MVQSLHSIGAGHRLEAYAILLPGLPDPDRANFQTLGELFQPLLSKKPQTSWIQVRQTSK